MCHELYDSGAFSMPCLSTVEGNGGLLYLEKALFLFRSLAFRPVTRSGFARLPATHE